MSISLGPITVSPGQNYKITIQNPGIVEAVKLTNGSQFDLTASGFGLTGQTTIPAGLEYMLYAEDNQQGFINFMPIDNLNVGGQGVVNATGYLVGEELPKGSWPVTVPAQRVIASQFAGQVIATNLVNTGNPLGQNVIQVQPAGDSNNTFTLDTSGNTTIGDAAHGGSLSVVGISTFGGRVQGNGASNLRLDTGGVGRAIEFDASGVQKGFFDSNGLNMNGDITFAATPVGAGFSSNLIMRSGYWIISEATRDLTFDTTDAARLFQFLNAGVPSATLGQAGLTCAVPAAFNGASFAVNAAAAFASQITPNAPVFSTVNGSVSGQMLLYCPIWGTGLKIGILVMQNNFQTASNVTVLFPSALNGGVFTLCGPIGAGTTWSFFNGASIINLRHVLTWGGANAAGTDESVTLCKPDNVYFGGPPADRIICQTTGAANINATSYFIGT